MISFLKKEDESKGGFMGKGDIIFLLVVAAVVGGFFYYTKTIKSQSAEKFAHCQQLWDSQQYAAAEPCYDEARDMQYVTDSLDSIVYLRLDTVQQIQEAENTFWAKADSAFSRQDTAMLVAQVKILPKFHFLDSAKVQRLQSWNALAKVPVDTTGLPRSK